jgi:hypothetical protein
MFCPECDAEYREGFARCTDCRVALVDKLPHSTQQERPGDETGTIRFLAWAGPTVLLYVLWFLVFIYPELLTNSLFFAVLFPLHAIGSLGGFWMLYQVVRYEKHVAKYIVIALIPFMFVWYYLGRYRMRQTVRPLLSRSK